MVQNFCHICQKWGSHKTNGHRDEKPKFIVVRTESHDDKEERPSS
jgi:hypothetical protein